MHWSQILTRIIRSRVQFRLLVSQVVLPVRLVIKFLNNVCVFYKYPKKIFKISRSIITRLKKLTLNEILSLEIKKNK